MGTGARRGVVDFLGLRVNYLYMSMSDVGPGPALQGWRSQPKLQCMSLLARASSV